MSGDHVELEGEVVAVNRDKFTVMCGEHKVIAQISGKMRKRNVRVLLGDHVKVKVSPYDLTRGFITYRKLK